MKKVRIKSEKTLNKYRQQTCEACEKPQSSNPAHIKSVGAGGDDADYNLLALCFTCHRLSHDIGWKLFCNKFKNIEKILNSKGWEFCEIGGISRLFRI